jgi:hypothetical protein
MAKRYITLVILCTVNNVASILLCLAGYWLNIGWYRFLLGIIVLPILIAHYIIHLSLLGQLATLRRETIAYSCLSNVAMVLTFIFWPDIADAPGTYAVFGQYKSPPDYFWIVAQGSLLCSFALTAMTRLTTKKGI